MRIAYLVHDLADAAVARRLETLQRGGAKIDLYGFYRGDLPPQSVAGVTPRVLGHTRDGRLSSRALCVFWRCLTVIWWARQIGTAKIILARNLETLVLAMVARRLFAPRAGLIYELLDIHSVMLRSNLISKLLRRVEGWMLRSCNAVMISSAAFEREYLRRFHPVVPRILLAENKVFWRAGAVPQPIARFAGPPWRIGWLGVIRCRRSLEVLSALVERHPDLVQVEMFGRIANTDMGDVDAVLNRHAGLRFNGPYDYFRDLPRIYGSVHFVWAIDFYEEGGNSNWLLPNRLYEGSLFGAVPIGLQPVETGHWLERNDVGLVLAPPLDQALDRLVSTLSPQFYQEQSRRLEILDRDLLLWSEQGCRNLVADMALACRQRDQTDGVRLETEHSSEN